MRGGGRKSCPSSFVVLFVCFSQSTFLFFDVLSSSSRFCFSKKNSLPLFLSCTPPPSPPCSLVCWFFFVIVPEYLIKVLKLLYVCAFRALWTVLRVFPLANNVGSKFKLIISRPAACAGNGRVKVVVWLLSLALNFGFRFNFFITFLDFEPVVRWA